MKTSLIIVKLFVILLFLGSCSPEKKQSEYGNENIFDSDTITDDVKPVEITEVKSMDPFGFATVDKDTFQLEDGLKMIVIEKGIGNLIKKNQNVSIHYTGYLTDGTQFDSSVDKGKPYSFVVGTGAVIDGWDMAIPQLRKGAKARILIPSHLGYGSYGFPPLIPPDSDLIFDVEVM